MTRKELSVAEAKALNRAILGMKHGLLYQPENTAFKVSYQYKDETRHRDSQRRVKPLERNQDAGGTEHRTPLLLHHRPHCPSYVRDSNGGKAATDGGLRQLPHQNSGTGRKYRGGYGGFY